MVNGYFKEIIQPISPPPNTSQAEFILYLSNRTPAANASNPVGTSTKAARPNCQVTTAISARDATFTPSINAPITRELRRRGISGPLTATNKNDGRKMPTVAASAAFGPPRM